MHCYLYVRILAPGIHTNLRSESQSPWAPSVRSQGTRGLGVGIGLDSLGLEMDNLCTNPAAGKKAGHDLQKMILVGGKHMD